MKINVPAKSGKNALKERLGAKLTQTLHGTKPTANAI
jgi:hypothetical protein